MVRHWNIVNRAVLACAAVVCFCFCAACDLLDHEDGVQISIPEPYAGRRNPAGSHRILSGARVRLRERGFIHKGNEGRPGTAELWVWHEGQRDALEARLWSTDARVSIGLVKLTVNEARTCMQPSPR